MVAQRLPITAAVLAGGKSTRMGTDKRALELGGECMLARVVSQMSTSCERVLVVVGEQDDSLAASILGEGTEIVVDCVKGFGPLAGLVTAFTRARSEWVLAVAADMPLLKPEVIALLWERRGRADAVVPTTHRGLEPLLALYNVRCFGAALDVLGTPKGGPRRLLDLVEVAEVTEAQLRRVDPSLDSLVNINTPADAARAAGLFVPTRSYADSQPLIAYDMGVASI